MGVGMLIWIEWVVDVVDVVRGADRLAVVSGGWWYGLACAIDV